MGRYVTELLCLQAEREGWASGSDGACAPGGTDQKRGKATFQRLEKNKAQLYPMLRRPRDRAAEVGLMPPAHMTKPTVAPLKYKILVHPSTIIGPKNWANHITPVYPLRV